MYPLKQIVIIDDNSKQELVKADFDYKNLTIIQSEYHRRIPFELFNLPVMPLWHHIYDKENVNNILRITSALTNKYNLIKKINGEETNILGLKKDTFILCFGCQSYIQLSFLELLQKKYNITNLVNVIRNRTDRCSLERIMGLLFCEEYPKLVNIKSLFGDIITKNKTFQYNYDQYKVDLKNGKIIYPFVKVWTGR
jgi:hypothetical protein